LLKILKNVNGKPSKTTYLAKNWWEKPTKLQTKQYVCFIWLKKLKTN